LAENKEVGFFSRQDSPYEKRIAGILRVLGYAGMAFVVAMMTLTVVHAVGRYAFNKPILGLVEMSSFMLVIVIFLAGAYTQVVKGHIRVGVVVDRFSERTQAIIDSGTYILCLALAIVALWQAVVRGIYIMEAGYVSIVLGIPHFPFLFIVALGWGIFGLAILMHLIHFLPRAIRGPRQ